FVDPPDSRMISDGFKLLEELQAVTEDGKLSNLGKRLVNIPLDPRFARMLLESAKNGCLAEVMIITTGLSIQDPRERPADKQQAADQSHKKWQEPNSDFVSLLNLWRHFEEQRQQLSGNQYSRYCKRNHVSYLRMREWRDLHHQVHTACRGLKLTANTEPAEQDAIHRSILSGLLGQVGILQDKWEYLGTRNRKFFIFPGSGLSKKPPKWLMAGSLMETTKQFALTVAKIDSDWLEPLAAHLVKKSYSEPFYNKKSGQVMAKERQTLFGLSIVENKNRVYGQVAPQEARNVFIQQALVEEGYRGKGEFYRRNHKLVAELQALEDRFRRRDLLVEQQAIFDFYDQLVPEAIYNLTAFEKWRKQAEAKTPKLLLIDKEYLLLRGLSQDEQAQFPETISCDGIPYQLRYHFQPGHAEDGVSAVVPLALLHQLPRYFFEWLVPGMLRDKCIALIKSLPKQTRRHFVPVPDHVDVFLRKAKSQDRPLTEVLAEHLRTVSGVVIEPEQWRQESLDNWYQMNFVLEDDQGVTIAMARSLEQLQRDFKQQISQGLEKAADQSTSRQGITEWDFDELPEEVALQHGKISIKAWPALRDCGDSVSLEVMDNPLQAEKVSRQGQLRLALLRGREQVKYLEKNLLRGKDLALKAANVGARQRLIDALISASFQQAVFSGHSVVRDQQQFDQAYDQGISQVVGLAQSYTESIETLLPRLHDLQKQLRGLGLPAIYAAEDIRNQLDWLFASETLCTVTDEIISQYPRYINAIQVRVEKLTQQQSKDRQHIAEISDLLTDCRQALIEDQPLSSDLEAALLDYCWLVEEYRVSLFAQQLKTRVPVSLKRLNKRWVEVDEQLRRFRVQAG
ncbi:MAG: ATP-dependent RNA helicase HrpA, partial [Porticoccaceae bacterium]|nr:ATP-dependent RNA helicase HrpA [Porticoccaceae bacterium]